MCAGHEGQVLCRKPCAMEKIRGVLGRMAQEKGQRGTKIKQEIRPGKLVRSDTKMKAPTFRSGYDRRESWAPRVRKKVVFISQGFRCPQKVRLATKQNGILSASLKKGSVEGIFLVSSCGFCFNFADSNQCSCQSIRNQLLTFFRRFLMPTVFPTKVSFYAAVKSCFY